MKIVPSHFTSRALCAIACIALAVSNASARQSTAPFQVLDNLERDDVDLTFAPAKPMVLEPGSVALWAINTHGSTVSRFVNNSTTPDKIFGVPWGPVSVEYWVPINPLRAAELLVVSRGTYALTRYNPTTGDVLDSLELPPEPAGTLIVGDHLFVACSAWDVVVEIDLNTNTIWDRYEIATSKHLWSLCSDGNGRVLVAPMLSGNNSMAKLSSVAGVLPVTADSTSPPIDMSTATNGLPDDDVYRLIPGSSPFTGTFEVAVRGLGTNLFAIGIQPTTGKLWCVNSDSHNTGAGGHGAPALKTRSDLFTTSGISICTVPVIHAAPTTTHTFVELVDKLNPNSARTLAKPAALAFTNGNLGLIAGASTDNVRIVDSNGIPVSGVNYWPVSDGAIPRGVLYDSVHNTILVYCWGTNKVEVYTWLDVASGGAPNHITASLPLGYDPATADVKKGREIFYDTRRSKYGNASCETCHVDGLFDFLVWENSSLPYDDKGPMFTQSLRGIADKRPYHWRGEQNDLVDFNGVFSELFDSTPLSTGPGSDFEKLQKYLFQLENPANPFEDERRLVTNDTVVTRFNPPITPHTGVSAVNGQSLYFTAPTVGNAACNACHTLPTGTDSDFFEDGFTDQHHRATFDVPAYNGLWRKEAKSRVTTKLTPTSTPETRAPLGSSTSHTGIESGVFEFVTENFPNPQNDKEDMAFFLHQVDSGLAPAVHRGRLLANNTLSNGSWIFSYLIPQAQVRNCDIGVYGYITLNGAVRKLRWYWNRNNNFFDCEDPTVTSAAFVFFNTQALNGMGRNMFIGLPVGMGRRWAVDYDGDNLFNLDETAHGTDPYNPDTDNDGFYDGVEVFNVPPSNPTLATSTPVDTTPPVIKSIRLLYKTAKIAKFIVETNELTRLTVDYTEIGGATQHTSSDGWKRLHTVLLRDLKPSYSTLSINRTYSVVFNAFDQSGNVTASTPQQFTTDSFITASEPFIARDVRVKQFTNVVATRISGTNDYQVTFGVELEDVKNTAHALTQHVALTRVIRTPSGGSPTRWALFTNNAAPVGKRQPPVAIAIAEPGSSFNPIYLVASDPYAVGSVVTSTTAPYISSFDLTLSNCAPGDVVQFSIETAGEANATLFKPNAPVFTSSTMFELASTDPAARVSAAVTLP